MTDDVAREDVEALLETALKPLEHAYCYCYGEDAATNERVHAEAIGALARLHSLLLRAEEERDAEALRVMRTENQRDEAEEERDALRGALERIQQRLADDALTPEETKEAGSCQ